MTAPRAKDALFCFAERAVINATRKTTGVSVLSKQFPTWEPRWEPNWIKSLCLSEHPQVANAIMPYSGRLKEFS